MAKPTLDFFFDYSSPFAYLGAVDVEKASQQHDAELVYRPMLLGALFQAIGTPMVPLHTFPEAKRQYYAKDLKRWAEYRETEFKFPTKFPMNTVRPLRLTLLTLEHEPEKVASLVMSIFKAYWAEDRDISDPNVLTALCEATDVDTAYISQLSEDAVKNSLKDATAYAVESGVCGAPCYRVGDMLFWGQDRLELAEQALRGWKPQCG